MQEITVKNTELAVRVQEKHKRAQFMQTVDGKKRLLQIMLEIFEYLRLSGYKLPTDNPTRMAEIWAEQMRDYIVTYGTDVIKDAARQFVLNDNREYRQYPNATQIIREAKKMGHDPDVELARAEYEARIAQMEQEQTEKARRELTPEIREKWSKKIEKGEYL